MNTQQSLGGTFTFPGTKISVQRLGYGAMQLAGPHVYGPPRDMDAALAVLREVVESGINHIDTSDYYGPHITNQILRKALYPYAKGLVIVTKVGNRRAPDKSWPTAISPDELKEAIHDNLKNLGLEALDIVNLRLGGTTGAATASLADPLKVLVDLKRQGLIRHIGLSNITAPLLQEALDITDIVCVQNHYNLAHRGDDALIDKTAAKGIAFVPFFPLGGFNPLQSATLDDAAKALQATPMQVALAWLLQRSPNILLIPGTSSIKHLHENIQAAALKIPQNILTKLDSIGKFPTV